MVNPYEILVLVVICLYRFMRPLDNVKICINTRALKRFTAWSTSLSFGLTNNHNLGRVQSFETLTD